MEQLDYKKISYNIETKLSLLFDELRSGMSAREDSRAFGAMVERRITDNWAHICEELEFELVEVPGRRTIFDFACRVDGVLFGFDVKTKDLDKNKYSDGGVCAVGNLLKFLANDKGVFMIVEFGHTKTSIDSDTRDIEYIRVAPFHSLPQGTYRIENLGTGQVRLNYSINQTWEDIKWERTFHDFFEIFSNLALTHYKRVKADADLRIQSIKKFRESNYGIFKFFRQ